MRRCQLPQAHGSSRKKEEKYKWMVEKVKSTGRRMDSVTGTETLGYQEMTALITFPCIRKHTTLAP